MRLGSGVTNVLNDVFYTCKRIVFFLTEELLKGEMLKLKMLANPHVQDLLSLYSGMICE